MAQPERELTREQHLEEEISNLKQQLGKEISRRDLLIKGIAVGVGAVAIAGLAGKIVVEGDVRGQFLKEGVPTPELEKALLGKDYIIHQTNPAVTGQTLSNAGLEFSAMPELQGTTVLTVPSERKWIGFKGTNLYRPREEDATLKDLRDSVTSSRVGSLRKDVESDLGSDRSKEVSVVLPEAIDLLSLEHELNARGETMFTQPSHILTSSTFEVIEGVDEEGEAIVVEKGVGIGRNIIDGPLRLIVINLTAKGPAPAYLFAGGIVVEK
ncbi:MAG: hypothetical protein COU25_02865 [Candidatus Levybacteria bacterium CG10_big_fil_rev_8_21_14_0_10_35_13]|nr:MAG: hypothetical protein COU25_02865 [Candidatus Levybacteria bacterium CG10_big_fil_rev_8_21_14_0_10_35_13]